MYLTNAWYVAGWAQQIEQGLHSIQVLGEKICLVRDSAGRVSALEDACPHRRLPLSMGRLLGDTIECGYHGLQFDCHGACIAAPGNSGRIPNNAAVRAYPVVERYGLIWIWMGEAARADENALIEVAHYDDPEWGINRGAAIELGCNYQLINDNLLDPSHVAWVHSSSFGEASARDTPIDVEVRDNGVLVSRWMLNCEPAPFYRDLLEFDGRCDRLQHYEVRYPSNALIRAVFSPAGSGGRDKPLAADSFVMDSYNFMTPVDEGNTRYYWFQLRNTRPHDEALSQSMSAGVRAAFEEDRVILNAVQQGIDAKPDGMINMHIDAGALRFRRQLKSLIDAEQG